MRIEKEMKGQGYFWLPCTPDQKAPGTLSISDGGIIKLEVQEPLNGKFDNRFEDTVHWRKMICDPQLNIFQPKDFEPKNKENTQRVIQQIEQSRKIKQIIGRISGFFEHTVILNNCHYERITGAIGRAESLIHAEIAFTSRHLNKANFDKVNYSESKINDIKSVNFSIEGINEWVGISGIKTHHESQEKRYISYQRPTDIPIQLNNDMQLSIEFRETENGVGVPFIQAAGISQETFFNLTSQKPRKLEEFTAIIDKITTFLCFFTCQTVSLEHVIIDTRKPINVFYQSKIHAKYKPRVQRGSMLLDFRTMGDDAEILINNWIKAYKEYERAFGLYFSTKTRPQMPLEDKFLVLARGLEIYYRTTSDDKQIEQARLNELIKLCKDQCTSEDEKNFVERNLSSHNTLSLRRRIEKIIEPFEEIIGDKSIREELVKQITKTRHDLTHEGTSPEEDLQKLYLKTESIFQLLLLQSIGFNQGQINNIVWWHPRLKRPFLDY